MKTDKKTTCRGFQCFSPSKLRKVSKLGALALHEQGKAHVFNSKTAKRASKKGVAARLKK